MAASLPAINCTPVRNRKTVAVCCCCSRRSRPVTANADGEPTLWNLARGWSEAPYPADFTHPDGSVGSTWTCPDCNKRLARGEMLTLRGTSAWKVRNVA